MAIFLSHIDLLDIGGACTYGKNMAWVICSVLGILTIKNHNIGDAQGPRMRYADLATESLLC